MRSSNGKKLQQFQKENSSRTEKNEFLRHGRGFNNFSSSKVPQSSLKAISLGKLCLIFASLWRIFIIRRSHGVSYWVIISFSLSFASVLMLAKAGESTSAKAEFGATVAILMVRSMQKLNSQIFMSFKRTSRLITSRCNVNVSGSTSGDQPALVVKQRPRVVLENEIFDIPIRYAETNVSRGKSVQKQLINTNSAWFHGVLPVSLRRCLVRQSRWLHFQRWLCGHGTSRVQIPESRSKEYRNRVYYSGYKWIPKNTLSIHALVRANPRKTGQWDRRKRRRNGRASGPAGTLRGS